MKRLFFISCFIFLSFAAKAENLWMFLDVCQFSDLEGKPYIEAYISIDGATVKFVPASKGKFQGSVNLVYFIYKVEGKDSTLISGDNLNLTSLEISDSSESQRRSKPFRHLIRTPLNKGNYTIVVEAKDNNGKYKNMRPTVAIYDCEVTPRNADAFSMSEPIFISSFTKAEGENMFVKNGYEIIPYNTNGFFVDKTQLSFYAELYHANKSFTGNYLMRAQVKQGEKAVADLTKIVKKSATEFDVFTHNFDISKLAAGNYTLEISAWTEKNQVIQKISKPFDVVRNAQTQALILSRDVTGMFDAYTDVQLAYFIKTLFHVSNGTEITMGKSLSTRQERIDYLYSFWKKRADLDEKTTVALLWDMYLKKLEYVNQKFKAVNFEGWETARGRVIMRYGKPSNLEMFPSESNLLPYEIWTYDRLETQSNVIFVFADLDRATNSYTQIHSSKFGEMQNRRWRDLLVANRHNNMQQIDYEDPNRTTLDPRLNPNAGSGDR